MALASFTLRGCMITDDIVGLGQHGNGSRNHKPDPESTNHLWLFNEMLQSGVVGRMLWALSILYTQQW